MGSRRIFVFIPKVEEFGAINRNLTKNSIKSLKRRLLNLSLNMSAKKSHPEKKSPKKKKNAKKRKKNVPPRVEDSMNSLMTIPLSETSLSRRNMKNRLPRNRPRPP